MFCPNLSNLLVLGVILLKLSTIANCVNLFGLPLKSPKSNVQIEATLTDRADGNERWSVSEDLAGVSVPHGKIRATKSTRSFEIFYHQSFPDNDRLVIADNKCTQLGSKPDEWPNLIPNDYESLLNLLLVTGPSIIYRLSDSSLKWDELEMEVDGVRTKVKNTTIDGTLRIKAHFKDDETSNIEKAIRFEFHGYYKVHGASFPEDLVLNIVTFQRINEDIEMKVHPPTGIGCPTYFKRDLEFPKLTTRQLHFTATETLISGLKDKIVSGIEVYVDNDMQLTRVGIGNDYSINDFNLGVSYIFNVTKCVITPFSLYISGLVDGHLNVNEINWMNGPFKYVGKTIYEPRARGLFDTWESVEYDRIIDGLKHEKIVTTQYMARLSIPNGPTSLPVDYVPVAMVRVAYKKNQTDGKYSLIETRRRDISEFQRAITKTQYQNLFSISECFDQNQRTTLTFDIRSEESGYTCNTGIQFAEENVNQFKTNFRNELIKLISPLRIASVALDFNIDRISAKVEFLERPSYEKSFQSTKLEVNAIVKYMTTYGTGISAKSVPECLKSQIRNTFREIIFCPSSNGLCFDIGDMRSLPENSNEYTNCTLYTFPLTNQKRLSSEIELQDLHKTLLRIENMMVTMKCENCATPKTYRFRITNILDYTAFHKEIDKRPNFIEVSRFSKLDSSNNQVQSVTGSINSFIDCYRTCSSPNNSECLSFSFCSNGDTYECLTSNTLYNPNITLSASNCTIYGRDFISEYRKAPNRQFSDKGGISFATQSADECASKCSQSSKCFSFQYCTNNQCTFTVSSYSIKRFKQDTGCDVYIPKKSQEFMVTGSTLVLDYILNESKLDMEQCAALCYNWKAGNESCRSFNFCPKGRLESTCQLTQYSVGDPSVQTLPSQNCFNFELLKPPPPPARAHSVFLPKDDMSSATTSISLAFLIIGLALGVAITSIYHAVHNRHKYQVTADQDSDT